MNEKVIVFIRSSGIYYDSRATKEIWTLAEEGYNLEIIGWDRTGDAQEKCKEIFYEIIDYINFHFFDLKAYRLGVRNIHKLLQWVGFIKDKLANIYNYKNIFAIHACDFDTGFAVRRFVKKNKIHLIYDIYDYYCDSHNMPRILSKIVSCFENSIVNISDVTIICTEERKVQIEKAHPSKVVVIYNSPDIKEDTYIMEKEFDYVYCGTLSGSRLIKEILEEYHQHTNIKMTFAGTGQYAKLCRELDAMYKQFNYVGVIPYSKVLELEGKSKVISAIYDPSIRNHKLCAPNKFYEALALGVPIIVCKGTGIDLIVKSQHIGDVINYNADSFYQSLEKLIMDDEKSKRIGKRAREIYEKRYKWKYMKEKLIKLYRDL